MAEKKDKWYLKSEFIALWVCIFVSSLTAIYLLSKTEFTNKSGFGSEKLGYYFTIIGTLITVSGLIFAVVQGYQTLSISRNLELQKEEIENDVRAKILDFYANSIETKCQKFIQILNTKNCNNDRCCDYVRDIIELLIEYNKLCESANLKSEIEKFKKDLDGDEYQFQKKISTTKEQTKVTLTNLLNFSKEKLRNPII